MSSNDIYDRVLALHPDIEAEIEKIVEAKMKKLRISAVREESPVVDIDNEIFVEAFTSPLLHKG